jgi:hypothetical protein
MIRFDFWHRSSLGSVKHMNMKISVTSTARYELGCALTFASEAKFEIEAKISFRLEAKKKPDFT